MDRRLPDKRRDIDAQDEMITSASAKRDRKTKREKSEPEDAPALIEWLTRKLRAFKVGGKRNQLKVFAIYTDDSGRQHYHCQEPCWCGWRPGDARGFK